MQYEVTLSPSAGVHVGFKIDADATTEEQKNAVSGACDLMRVGLDEWEAWSEKNSTPTEAAMKKMVEEQREAALEQWEQQKKARAQAEQLLSDELASRRNQG